MKKTLFITSLIILILELFATEQVPDILLYNKMELTLSTGWGHPSPLQTYFYQNNLKSPFHVLSTANYRGHIATWIIQNDHFFLKTIKIRDSIFNAQKFNIKSKKDTTISENLIFADWFSGIIECQLRDKKNYWNIVKSYYFHIKYGRVIEVQEVSENDFKKIQKISVNDTSDRILMKKYKILYMNQNYISYYFRLSENDKIILDSEECLLNTGVEKLSPIYGFFNNNHLDWLYNWENYKMCGAPHCTWIVDSSKIYLRDLTLYSGLNFESIAKQVINLDVLFKNVINNKVFANWINGILLIKHGDEKEDELLKGYKEFVSTKYTYLRIKDGVIVEKYTIPADFNYRKMAEKDIDAGLKKIIEEY